MRIRRFTPLLILALLILVMAACTEDNEPVPGPGPDPEPSTRVLVLNGTDDAPVEGVKVVVMDNLTNLPLAAPLLSDTTGICDFGILPDVDRSVLVFGGGLWRSFGVTETIAAPEPAAMLAPVAAAGAPTELMVRVTPILPPGGAHISGTVIDAATGEPLDLVFLAPYTWAHGYLGAVGPRDDVTMADGAFRVSEIVFAPHPVTGNPIQLEPLFITRHGYLPRVWRYPARPGEIIDDIVAVVIPLQPDEATERGSLRGRLLRLGVPVSGIVVALGTATTITSKSGPGMTGWTTISDSNGIFVFTDLPADRYVAHPAYLPGDSAFFFIPDSDPRHYVTADTETDAGDYDLVWEVDPLIPPTGTRVPAMHREFVWEAVPGAATYEFYLDRRDPVVVDEPTRVLPGIRPLTEGNHWWSMIAYDAAGFAIGTFGQAAEFHVAPEDEGR